MLEMMKTITMINSANEDCCNTSLYGSREEGDYLWDINDEGGNGVVGNLEILCMLRNKYADIFISYNLCNSTTYPYTCDVKFFFNVTTWFFSLLFFSDIHVIQNIN